MRSRFSIFAVLLLCGWCASCSNNSSAAKAGASPEAGAASPSSLGPSSFSAVIDGTPVSGGIVDDMQQTNAAYSLPGNSNHQPTILFILTDKKPTDTSFFPPHLLRFQFPKQTGAITKDVHIMVDIQLTSDKSVRYGSKTVTVTVTSMTDSRISGTFSGGFTSSPDTPNPPKTAINITDGKFDLPFATSKIVPN